MALEPFPSSALPDNRQLRLTAEQARALQADAQKSKRSLGMAGVWLLALGILILWGTAAGRVPGSKLQSFLVGGAMAGVGALLLSPRAKSSGVSASQSASAATKLEMIEGPIRREQYDRQPLADLAGSSQNIRGDARYHFYLHIGGRRFDVGRPDYEAAPAEGIVRAYLLPGSDRIVNLERIGDAPPTAGEQRATEMLNQRFGQVSQTEHAAIAAVSPGTAEELRAALIGRWQAQGLPIVMEFRADGTVTGGDGVESRSWEALDETRVRIDGEEQRVETDGRTLLMVSRGPTLRFNRTE